MHTSPIRFSAIELCLSTNPKAGNKAMIDVCDKIYQDDGIGDPGTDPLEEAKNATFPVHQALEKVFGTGRPDGFNAMGGRKNRVFMYWKPDKVELLKAKLPELARELPDHDVFIALSPGIRTAIMTKEEMKLKNRMKDFVMAYVIDPIRWRLWKEDYDIMRVEP
jgi:hypothetical protein